MKTTKNFNKVIKFNQQKNINRMLKNIKSNREYYITYGKVIKITLFLCLVLIDFVIPSFRLLTLFAIKNKDKLSEIEILRINIK